MRQSVCAPWLGFGILFFLLTACASDSEAIAWPDSHGKDAAAGDAYGFDAGKDVSKGDAATATDSYVHPDATEAQVPEAESDAPKDLNAYLHADVWSVWWNDRTRCGAERTFLHLCQNRGKEDCGVYQQAYSVCNPMNQVYGQVGPEKQSEELCRRSKYPDVGGCIAADYDFDKLRFWWYGAEWEGNWPAATLKIFQQGADWTKGGELIALSNVPGAAQGAMAGISNHGLGFGCAMLGVTSGDSKYQKPFGGFAWVSVPVGQPLTVVAAAACNFADKPFQGCSRGASTQQPWITGAPGATLGCVYLLENVVFEAGHHYYWRFGLITELATPAPPQELIDGFALPEVGKDIHAKEACKL